MSDRDEYKIWMSRWEGKRVMTPDGAGVCSGFHETPDGVEYQVRFGTHETRAVTYRDYPRNELKLKGEK